MVAPNDRSWAAYADGWLPSFSATGGRAVTAGGVEYDLERDEKPGAPADALRGAVCSGCWNSVSVIPHNGDRCVEAIWAAVVATHGHPSGQGALL